MDLLGLADGALNDLGALDLGEGHGAGDVFDLPPFRGGLGMACDLLKPRPVRLDVARQG